MRTQIGTPDVTKIAERKNIVRFPGNWSLDYRYVLTTWASILHDNILATNLVISKNKVICLKMGLFTLPRLTSRYNNFTILPYNACANGTRATNQIGF